MPSHIMELTNFSASVELYIGSGRISRGSGLRLRGICYFLGSHFAALWAAWLRISIGSACGPRLRPYPASRAPRDSARRADPSRGRRGSARSSAPADCGRRLGYRWSLRFRWSGARAPLCAAPSSASWAWWCTRACTRRASAGRPAAPDSRSYSAAVCRPFRTS